MGESANNSPALTTRLFLCGLRSYRAFRDIIASTRLRNSASTWIPYVSLHIYFLIGQNFYSIVSVPFTQQQLFNSSLLYLAYNALLFSGLFQYFKVLFSNPGYVLVKPAPTPMQLDTIQDNNSQSATAGDDLETAKLIQSNGESNNAPVVPPEPAKNVSNFCGHCDSWRAPRSKHCYHCGKCVVKFDHHCPFFHNCIGGRNHRQFWWFLLTETILLSWTFTMVSSELLSLSSKCSRSTSTLHFLCRNLWKRILGSISTWLLDWSSLGF
jgi:hypothetical protein